MCELDSLPRRFSVERDIVSEEAPNLAARLEGCQSAPNPVLAPTRPRARSVGTRGAGAGLLFESEMTREG